MLQSEIDATMHPMPVLGSSGDPSIDLFLSSAEGEFKKAQEEVRQRMPIFTKSNDDVIRECISICAAAKGRCDSFLQMAESDLSEKRRSAERSFAIVTATMKPGGVTDEAISLRTHSLELLLDSLPVNKIITRLESEMKIGDQLTRYILRDAASGWIRFYLQSRNINMNEYYSLIGLTADILETDLMKSCEQLRRLPELEAQLAETRQSLKNSWDNLILGMLPKPAPKTPMQANSILEGLEDSCTLTAGDFRREVSRLSKVGRPGFFNAQL